MNSMEFNKIFAALLVAGIVASLSGFVAKKLTTVHELEKRAYTIEGVAEEGGAGPAAVAMPEPILAMIAAADVERGKQVSKACAACHNFDKGGGNGVGPNLWGLVNRAKGSHGGFEYSAGMKAKGGNWSLSELNHFLWKPKAFVTDTKMNFIGVKKPEDRAALLAYLRTLSDSPAALPSQGDIDKEMAELGPKEEAAPGGAEIPAAEAAPAH